MKLVGAADRLEEAEKVFPGEIAGASLKPPQPIAGRADDGRFSPAKSPGPH